MNRIQNHDKYSTQREARRFWDWSEQNNMNTQQNFL